MRQHLRHRRLLAGAVAALTLVAACGDDGGSDPADDGDTSDTEPSAAEENTGDTTGAAALPDGYEGHTSDVYGDTAAWVCHPDEDDVCARDLDATVVHPDGTTEIEEHEPADDPAIDCFYVYPTISRDEGTHSDMEPGESEEMYVTYVHAARLTQTCRVFAPVYRSVTLDAGGGQNPPSPDEEMRQQPYEDVRDAFRHYVANESDGRGFMLMGHSQGSGLVTRLIDEEIEGEPALQDRLVGGYVLGGSVSVPEDDVAGITFDETPLCEEAGQTGCVVTYASYRDTSPPPEDGRFGWAWAGEGIAGCTNPAALDGGPADLTNYTLVDPVEGSVGAAERFTGFAEDAGEVPEITTPFVTMPGLLTAECVHEGEFNYLSISVNGDPDDPRVDDIPGELTPDMGLHLVDVSATMGNIVDNVEAQAGNYSG